MGEKVIFKASKIFLVKTNFSHHLEIDQPPISKFAIQK